MTEYIIKAADWAIDYKGESLFKGCERIVRCRDCKHYYEAEEYHPNGNYDRRCCKYFGTYDDEVEPDGYCAWGEPREAPDQTHDEPRQMEFCASCCYFVPDVGGWNDCGLCHRFPDTVTKNKGDYCGEHAGKGDAAKGKEGGDE